MTSLTMANVGETSDQPGDRDDSAAKLRARICETADRIERLKGELCALREVGDAVMAKNRDLERQVAAGREEVRQIEVELEASRARLEEIDAERDAIEVGLPALERREARSLQVARRIAKEADAIEGELDQRSEAVSESEALLADVRESIHRIDQKLSFQQLKLRLLPRPIDAADRGRDDADDDDDVEGLVRDLLEA